MAANIFTRRNSGTSAPAQAPAAQAPVSTPASAPQTQAAPRPSPSAAPAGVVLAGDGRRKAPWGTPDCKACEGTGINSKQNPCPVCDAHQETCKAVTSRMFALIHDAQGMLVWAVLPQFEAQVEAAAGAAPAQAAPAEAPAATKAPFAGGRGRRKAAVEAPAAAPMQVVSETVGPEISEPFVVLDEKGERQAVSTTTTTATPVGEKKPVGRPKGRITLLINASWVRGPERKVITISEVLATYGKMLVEAHNESHPSDKVSSYFELDTWKRKDFLAARAEAIAEELGNSVVLCSNDLESKALVAALIPHADMVITGTV